MVFLSSALLCLSMAIYHESRGEPIQGQRAVAYVVMNRAETENKSVCDVIKEKAQFSWVKPHGRAERPKNSDAWFQSVNVAANVFYGKVPDPTNGSNHFYSLKARAPWANSCKKSRKIGHQLFCYIPRKDAIAYTKSKEVLALNP